MTIRGINLLTNRFVSSRSRTTCVYKCGDACNGEAPNEFASANAYFGDVVKKSFSRRRALQAGGGAALVIGGGSVLAACGDNSGNNGNGGNTISDGENEYEVPRGMRFDMVSPNMDDKVTVPEGYEDRVLIAWGDPIFEDVPKFDFENQTAKAQEGQYGFNNDYGALVETPGGQLVHVSSHEYTTEPMMFHDWTPEDTTEEQVNIGLAAHGLTVLAVDKGDDGFLTPVIGHPLNRRITANTEFEIAGPAAGHDLLKTEDDPTGTKVYGTLNNCAGGLTPWGTILSGEENCNQYFGGFDQIEDEEVQENLSRYGITSETSTRNWEKFHDRFDLTKQQNEPNRFFYVVEIDPADPESTPIKHSALGRFKHEGGNIYITDDGTVVCYSGDDERFEYIYKFVSSRKMVEGDLAHNMGILNEGTLYVAQFDGNSPESEIDGSAQLPEDGAFDGSITWIPLMTANADGTSESHVDGFDGAEVCIYTRQAADTVNPTRMDRPEDVEPSPITGKVYAALTNNKYRGATGEDGTDAAGREYEGVTEVAPVTENKNGYVIEMDDDHAGTSGTWNLLLVCGDPDEAYTYFGGFDKSQVSPITCPDNLAFDEYGNLWVSTDALYAMEMNDGLYAVSVDGDTRGLTKLFMSVPYGAETCGPIVEHDLVMVNAQHPGENDEATTEDPTSNWPDGGDSQPRPAVIQVRRTDGGAIGM
ncbi:PhoX family protein [Corynebacterium sputi]|uniref:PhoX family protein n=1 Tax=Corynebacterium sputi TaxID=489915 RepID=UPI000427C075|nr:PhoX family phosphatase [Corynebacterium sputi]